LEAVRTQFVGDGMDHHLILEAHEMMLRDQALYDEAKQLIETEQRNAEWAVNKVISRLRGLLDRVSDSYFRERRTDIDFVGERILRNLGGQSTDVQEIEPLQQGTIVVAHDLSPVDTALLAGQRITAFVTEVGGKTSHTSIVSRSLGVPAVVGTHGVFDAAGSGDTIIVDGLQGMVIVRPTSADLEAARRRAASYQQRVNFDLIEAKALPARTLDGVDLIIAGNIELPNEIGALLDRGGEAIGLYRTEFMYLGRRTPPGEEDHYRTYCQIFDEMGDRPVTVRTLDLGGEKIFEGMAAAEAEPNPALGMRAVRYCLERPEIFEPQLAGLLRAGTRGDLRVMLPMISGVDELRQVREVLEGAKRRLVREGKEFNPNVPIGVMVEVPSAAATADLLARESDFFAIGTNDLMQYLLAIDRTNDRVAYLYDPLHPAMLRTLHQIVSAARGAGIPVSICGEMAGDPEHTAILVGMGFDQLSMNAGSIPQVKRLVRELNHHECVTLVEDALRAVTVAEVNELVRDFLAAKAPLASSMWSDADDPDEEPSLEPELV